MTTSLTEENTVPKGSITGATTGLSVHGRTENTLGTTREAPTSTPESGSVSTEATTSSARSETKDSGPSTEATTSLQSGITNSGIKTATTKVSPGTHTSPGSSNTTSTLVSNATSHPGCPVSPSQVCHGPLGEKKSPGDIWTANCHRCICTDSNSVDCKPQVCPSPPTCKTGEKLIKFKSNDTCCEVGYCEPKTCLFNNTDYEVGASFDDPRNPCVSYSCHNTGFIAVVQDCPKQTWCAEEDRVYDSKKCCYTCKTNCKSSPVNVTIRYNGCKKKIEMARCTGECKKTIKYNYDIFQLENSCLCCKEENYEFRNIVLDCPDGSTAPYRYRHITSCSCSDMCLAFVS
ncbi:hypothetical protein NP236_23480, partial [Salmonella enterica]|nr:hypothetical protein [Salmonella enterica]